MTRLLARERFALRPAMNADRLMKPIPHSVNLKLAGLFKHPLSKCLAQCKGGVDAAFTKRPAINGSSQRCLGLMAFPTFKVAFVVSYIEKQEERRSIGPFTAHVAQTDTVDPLTLGCELLFHVLRSGVPEIGARFLDLGRETP